MAAPSEGVPRGQSHLSPGASATVAALLEQPQSLQEQIAAARESSRPRSLEAAMALDDSEGLGRFASAALAPLGYVKNDDDAGPSPEPPQPLESPAPDADSGSDCGSGSGSGLPVPPV